MPVLGPVLLLAEPAGRKHLVLLHYLCGENVKNKKTNNKLRGTVLITVMMSLLRQEKSGEERRPCSKSNNEV